MKKTMLLIILLSLFTIFNVNAKTSHLVMEENTNLYYAMYHQDFYRSYSFFRYFQDGERVYCIDPDQKVTTDSYEVVPEITTIPDYLLEQIVQIGYFGSDYPGHHTLNYELATQGLIWEVLKGVTVRWYTERYSYGTEIDVSKERAEIKKLMAEYQKKPLLSNVAIRADIGDHIAIFDSNYVLDQYEIVSFSGGQAVIEENRLDVKLNEKAGSYELLLKRKKYDQEKTQYYLANQSQTMMKGRLPDEYLKIPIEIISGKVQLKKIGVSINSERSDLAGVKFELRARQNFFYQNGDLRYGQDELIGIYETDENGRIDLELPYGQYYFIEQETNDSYYFEPEFYNFEIKDQIVDMEIENHEKYGIIRILKKETETENPLFGIRFLITNLETMKTWEMETNENGEILFEHLPLGTYEIKEIETLPNYILNEEVKIIELKEHQEVVEYVCYNEKIPEIPDTASYHISFLWCILGYSIWYYGIRKK